MSRHAITAHLADGGAVGLGFDRQARDPDLQRPLLRQDPDDGTHMLRDAAVVAQLGDVLAESDGGGFQGAAGTDSGACTP
ncbi:hypothetical protein ACFXPA_45110 [Amycolatopsis sp. NPDC059090]|uniref:hypothetical protein n=1 Tax=Amycolatopsis sp. NPDC059090 TaxID=3346723 RepID=UPI00366EC916